MQTTLKEMPKEVSNHVKSITMAVTFSLLLFHIYFSFLFYFNNATILFYFNCVSILTYLFEFWLLKKNHSKAYVYTVFSEIFIFMLLTVTYLGWDLGFQHYCISFIATLLFTDFYINHEHYLKKRTIFLICGNVIVYIALRFFTMSHPAIYTIDNTITVNTIYISNTLISFGFLIMYFFIYSSTVNKLENELLDMANKDSLTKLWTRRNMMQIIASALEDQDTNINCIAMIDVDLFKKVNDTYGHDGGDEALKVFSKILQEKKKSIPGCEIARWGGEEFLILLKNYDGNRDSVIAEFEALRKQVESTDITCNENTFNITITIGISFYKDNISIDSLIKQADINLYAGKEQGRNVVIY